MDSLSYGFEGCPIVPAVVRLHEQNVDVPILILETVGSVGDTTNKERIKVLMVLQIRPTLPPVNDHWTVAEEQNVQLTEKRGLPFCLIDANYPSATCNSSEPF